MPQTRCRSETREWSTWRSKTVPAPPTRLYSQCGTARQVELRTACTTRALGLKRSTPGLTSPRAPHSPPNAEFRRVCRPKHDGACPPMKGYGQALFRFQKQDFENEKALRSEEHTSELQSRPHLVCRLLLE